jgi:N-acetylglucosaminyldiphosphoundecaprenol N-acetyl-beta-D-mannosaminyltransferase
MSTSRAVEAPRLPDHDVNATSPVPYTEVLGVRISAVSLASASQQIDDWAKAGERHYVTVTGVHGVIEGQDDPSFKRILNRAGLCVPDGVPMVWLSWLAGRKHVTRVFGPDMMLEVSALLARRRGRAFYYGGQEGVADQLAASMVARFPGLETAGTYCPPFRPLDANERRQVIAKINASRADVLWVGLSTPKQERWMAEFRPELSVPVLLGVGAAFDYNTGRVERAPPWIQRAGLEWLYRITQDPKRLWKRYARSNPLFLYYLACEKLGLRDFAER